MSNLEHITGAAFVGPTEAQYLQWLDEAAGEQKRLEAQRDRLVHYAKAAKAAITTGCSSTGLLDAEDVAWWELIDAGDVDGIEP